MITEIMTGAPAFLYDEEHPLLAHYASVVKSPAVIVGIGAGYGASGSLLLLNSSVEVYDIDPFIPDPHTGWVASAERCLNGVRAACAAAGNLMALARYRLIESTSKRAARVWARKKRPIGFLFIDGDHSYEAVRADVEAWLPFVVPGGVMALHDSRREPDELDAGAFARGWDGPTRAARELQTDSRVTLCDEAFSITAWTTKE